MRLELQQLLLLHIIMILMKIFIYVFHQKLTSKKLQYEDSKECSKSENNSVMNDLILLISKNSLLVNIMLLFGILRIIWILQKRCLST